MLGNINLKPMDGKQNRKLLLRVNTLVLKIFFFMLCIIISVTTIYMFFPLVLDPPRFDAEELEKFKPTVTVKKGHKAIFKIAYVGREPIKVQWYLEGEELSEESNIKIEHSEGSSQLLLLKLQRKDSGEVKIKLKNEFGTVEACSELNVLGMLKTNLPEQ